MRHRGEITPISEEDQEFFKGFLEKYEKFIMHIARKYACPGILAEDIAQEATIRLMKHIPKLRTLAHNPACSYISQAVQSAFIDIQRKEQRYAHVSLDPILEEVVGIERDLVPDLFLRQQVQRLRKHLTPRQWLALKGKYICGYSQEELGGQLAIAPDSVRTFLFRAREDSKEILSPEKVTGGGGDD